MKYFLIAGEASGDLHGSGLMRELKLLDHQAEFFFFGGDAMQTVGGTMLKHIREMAFMGFWAVFKNILKIKRNFKDCENALLEYQPDVLILIDYPGFNMRMAAFVHKYLQIPVYYYISPKVWVWKTYRVKKIKRYVDHLLTIFPFETKFFQKYNYRVNYVGNPTLDAVSQNLNKQESFSEFKEKNKLSDKPIIAVLPGSRNQEINACLPVILQSLKQFYDYQVVVSAAPGMNRDYYEKNAGSNSDFSIVFNQTYQLLYHAEVAVVNSGTATLETAIIGTPQVVVYHLIGGRLGYLAKELILKTKFVSLVNIIAGKEVVKELIAHLFNPENVKAEVNHILRNKLYREQMKESYQLINKELGYPGASKKAAQLIFKNESV